MTTQLPPIRRLVFWEPTLSPHTADFFAALAAAAPALEIICCADRRLADERMSLGWAVGEARGYRRIVAPDNSLIAELTERLPAESLHIFFGMRWVPSIVAGIAAVKRAGGRLALLSEPRVSAGLSGKLRYLQSWLTESWLRRHVEFVLAIGRNGPPWFRSVGYQRQKIFPFAYFVAPPAAEPAKSTAHRDVVQVGYVGRLVAAKGVFDLVSAMSRLGDRYRLTVVGDGPERDRLETRCSELGIDAEFKGVLPNHLVGDILAGLDVLVLASTTKDGWGVVVSEALMSGTAVVATSQVGASIVLDTASLGTIVPRRSPAAIARAIVDLGDRHAYSAEARQVRRSWAQSKLSADGGAAFLLAILRWSDGRGEAPLPFCCGEIDKGQGGCTPNTGPRSSLKTIICL